MQAAQVSTRRFRSPWAIGAGIVLVLVAVLLVRSEVNAVTGLNVTVNTDGFGTDDVIEFDGATYADVADAMEALGTGDGVIAQVPQLTGLPQTGASNARAITDADALAVAFIGEMNFAGVAGTELPGVQLAVVAQWPDDASESPDVAVLIQLANAGAGFSLADLDDSLGDLSVGSAIIGISGSEWTVEPFGDEVAGQPDLFAFFDDGNADTDDGIDLVGDPEGINSLNFQLAGGQLVEAADDLGGATDAIRLSGSITDANGFSLITGGVAPEITAASVTADIPLTTPSFFPEWVDIDGTATIGVSLDDTPSFSTFIAGSAAVAPDGENFVVGDYEAAFTFDPDLTFDFTVAFPDGISDIFGQEWFDLEEGEVSASIAAGSFSGALAGTIVLGPLTAEIGFEISADSGAGEFAVAAELTATFDDLSASGIISAITDVTIDDAIIDISIDTVSLAIDYSKSGGDVELFASLFGSTQLTLGNVTPDVDMLFRLTFDGDDVDLYGSAKASGLNLGDLSGDLLGDFSWELPAVTITVSTAATDEPVPFDDLDTPTALYYEDILCDADTGECLDLEIAQGVEILSAINLPDNVVDALAEIGIVGDGPILVSGTFPLFGSSEPVSLSIEFPPVEGPEDGLVASGQVSFFINVEPVGVEAGIEGELLFRIRRPSLNDCDGSEDGFFPGATTCFDELTLTVSASLGFSAGEVEISLRGEISEWDFAFGQEWLTINQFFLQFDIGTAAGTVGVTLSFGGSFVLDDQFDFTIAASATFTASPPWLIINGFTFGTGNGISVKQIGDLFGTDTSKLPNLSIRNFWFAWGLVDDPDNCIRQGIFISAELHLAAEVDTDEAPTCADNPLPDTAEELDATSCEESDTCLAAVLFDFNPQQPSFTAAGFIAGFDAGPVSFEPTTIFITVSPTLQRFTLSAGATLDDPILGTDDEWASGVIELAFENDAGKVSIEVEAQVALFNGGFEAYVHGRIAADFATIGNGGFTAWLDSFEFDLEVELSWPGLEKFAEDVLEGLEDAGEFAEDAWEETEQFFNDAGDDIEAATEEVSAWFEDNFGASAQQALLEDVSLAYVGAAKEIDKVVVDAYNDVKSVVGKGAADALLGRAKRFVEDEGGLTGVALYGLDVRIFSGWTECLFGECLEIIPPIDLTIPGECAGALSGNPICTTDGEAEDIADELLVPLVDAEATDVSGLTLPTTGADDALDVIEEIADTTPEGQTQAECLSFDYDTPGDASLGIDFFGLDAGQPDFDYAAFDLNDPTDLNQEGLDDAVDGSGNTTCAPPVAPPFAGGSSLLISAEEINEGDTLVAWGTLTPGVFGDTLQIDWGDGTVERITVAEITEWRRTHVYLDDGGEGPANNYVISLSTNRTPLVRQERVTVNNVDPVLSNLAVDASVITEGDTVTLTGDLSDVGVLDTHSVEVDWGDGTIEIVPLTFGDTSFSIPHTYVDEAVFLENDGVQVFPIRVTLTDKDTGTDVGAAVLVTVNNGEPTDPVVESIVDTGGTAFETTPEGDPIIPIDEESTWTFTFTDPGVDDGTVAYIEWGDGTSSFGTITIDPNDPTVRIVTATKTYTGVNNGSPLTVVVSVADDDSDPQTFSYPVFIGFDPGDDFACFVNGVSPNFTVSIVNGPDQVNRYDVFVGDEEVASINPPATSVDFTATNGGQGLIVTVTGNIIDSPDSVEATCGEIDVDDPSADLGIDKVYDGFTDNDTSGTLTVGDDLNYTITATNTGAVDLTNVVVFDDLTQAQITCPGPVAPGETCVLTTSYTVAVEDLGTDVDNTALADSDQTPSVTDTETVPVPGVPALSITKEYVDFDDLDGSTDISVGDTLNYEIVATNDGSVDLTDVVVDDDLTGEAATCAGPVAPGETCSLSTSYTVLATDLGTTVVNTATADSNETDAVEASAQVPVGAPGLSITKVILGTVDPDRSGDLSAGDRVLYRLTAVNTGETGLTGLTIVDATLGIDVDCSAAQAVYFPGDSCTTIVERPITTADYGSTVTNTGIADSVQAGPVSDTVSTDVPTPDIGITKSIVDVTDNDSTLDTSPGDDVNYSITVTNTGTATLTQVTIADDLTLEDFACGTVLPGETCTFLTSYDVITADLGSTLVNTATGASDQAGPVTDTVTTDVPTPAIAIDKAFVGFTDNDTSGTVTVGDDLNYEIVATNSGTANLTSVVVSDDLTGDSVACAGPIAPGETCVLTTSYTAQAADVGTTVDNTATATSDQAGPVTDTESVPVVDLVSPAIAIDKTFTGYVDNDSSGTITPGDDLEYSIVATNVGNVDLTSVVVDDDLTGDSATCVGPVATSETCVLTTSYTALDSDAGTDVVNTATATSDQVGPVTDTETVPVVAAPTPGIGIVKTFTGYVDNDSSGTITPGDELEYLIVATNDGDIDLTNVVVNDDLTGGSLTCAGPVAPGETCELITVYAALDSDAGTDVVNTATATSDQVGPVADTETVPVVDAPSGDPAIAIDKELVNIVDNDGSNTLNPGDDLEYLIVATNTGDIDLTNVVVDDDLTGDTVTCVGPVAPGETCELATSYTIVTADQDTDVVNTATADSDQVGPVDDTVTVPVPGPSDVTFICHGQIATIVGSGVIMGTIGDDVIVGSAAADEIKGGGGNDVVCALGGMDWIDLLGGDDVIYGGPGKDMIEAGAGDDVVFGDEGDDAIRAGAGDDQLFGGPGDDLLVGKDGNDHMVGGEGDDIFRGGLDTDTVDYSDSPGPVFVHLNGAPDDGTALEADNLQFSIEVVIGSPFDDVLIGTVVNDRLEGGDGNDRINGRAGSDVLLGGPGGDALFGGAADDDLDGGAGIDLCLGAAGTNVLADCEVDDSTPGDPGPSEGPLTDCDGLVPTITGSGVINGTGGDDDILGSPGADTIIGFGGNDVICGAGGNDIIIDYSGNDRLFGGDGNDRLFGGNGDDELFGGPGFDVLKGEAGNDVLDGGFGDDDLVGGTDDDTLIGGPGNDRFRGSTGTDTADYSASPGAVAVYLDGAKNDGTGLEADDVTTSVENVIGSAFDDAIVGDIFVNRIEGGDGDDRLVGRSGIDSLFGGPGSDFVYGGGGNDALDGGADPDRCIGASGSDTFIGCELIG